MRPPLQPLQGGSGRAPQNPQLMMQQQLLLQQQALQQRLRQQQHQNIGLNAAIRVLQQRTQHNQRHTLGRPTQNSSANPLRALAPSQNSTQIPNNLVNSRSVGLVGQPRPQLSLSINLPILRPNNASLNQHNRNQSNGFINPSARGPSLVPPTNSIPPQPKTNTSYNRSASPKSGRNQLALPETLPNRSSRSPNCKDRNGSSDDRRQRDIGQSDRRRDRDNCDDYGYNTKERDSNRNDSANRRKDSSYNGRDDISSGRRRESSYVGRDDNSSSGRRHDSFYHSNGRDRDKYGSSASFDSRSRRRSRSRSVSRERDRSSKRDVDRSRSRTQDERIQSRRSERNDYHDRERVRKGNNAFKDDRDYKQNPESANGERFDKGTSERSYGKGDYRERPRSPRKDERRSESVRSSRSTTVSSKTDSRSSESGRDNRSMSIRREHGKSPSSSSSASSTYSRAEKRPLSRSSSRNRRPVEDSMSGLSQYRQDLMRAEFEKELDEFLGKKRAQDNLENDKWDADMKDEEDEEGDKTVYITRSCPADLYFTRNRSNGNMDGTKKMLDLEKKFDENIVKQSEKVRASYPEGELPLPPSQIPTMHNHHLHCCHCDGTKKEGGLANGNGAAGSDSSSEEDGEINDEDDEDFDDPASNHMMKEWERRKSHPLCLHPELWYNETGQVNDGPLCRCSIKSRKSGIRHDIYPGEERIPNCNPASNNLDHLHHYRVTMSPYTNFLTKTPTLIEYDSHEYIFEGFSLFTHTPLENIPPCKVLRFNIEYTIHFIPESPPENFTVGSLDLFSDYLFTEVLELLDLDWGVKDGGCRRFHFFPRFCRSLPDSGCKEVLSMNTIMNYLIKSSRPLVDESRAKQMNRQHDDSWRTGIGAVRGMIVTKPGMKPSSVRVDQLDRNLTGSSSTSEDILYPLIIHQGYRPAQLSYSGDPMYRRAWKQYVQFRHLLNSKPKIYPKDKQRLKELEDKLQEICFKNPMKREVTVELNAKGFLCTGLRADLCQHALMIPVLMSHLRFHICLTVLEEQISYQFKDRNLLQLALTHTSYRTNFGTNPDHTRNSLTNCGMRQVEYGDRRVHYQNRRKRGICILLDIMSRFGRQEETASDVPHNERLEFLGDAVIEFLTSVHLFFMFPWLEEGGLSTYRMALVQNQHLTQLAKKLKLQDFMLYVHGPDLCHESDLRHAMANCCEALMGSLFLDGGLQVVDTIFSKTLFEGQDAAQEEEEEEEEKEKMCEHEEAKERERENKEEKEEEEDNTNLLTTWVDLPKHVLQQAEPGGDRHWVQSVPVLQKLTKFEDSIGVKFNHIRLLAKSFTHRNIGDNPLTMGHNQRLEFLGDTVLQLVASEYLYRHYPEHHEGHLSLLRSSLVNGRTQALVYDDLGMSEYVIYNEGALADGLDMKTKQKADMLEAFIGALYVDKGLDYCWAFCNVCFFPRLKDFILNQDWNDPKSQLQQCCLTLREVGGGEPDIPIYKMIESIGPTNSRKYTVAVYFRGSRLATGSGHTIQQSEMMAAANALEERAELFPILQHQKRFLEKMKKGYLGSLEGQGDENDFTTGDSASRAKKRRRKNNQREKRTEKMFTQKAESRLKEKDKDKDAKSASKV